jgi:sugar/nucleoside kinase (ribokinase family)
VTNDKYDFDKEVNITLSQAKMAILMEICTRIAQFGLSPEEEHVLREIESAAESEIDFIFDPDYKSMMESIRRKLRAELDL